MSIRSKLEAYAEALLDFVWGAIHTTEGIVLALGLLWAGLHGAIPSVPASVQVPVEAATAVSAWLGGIVVPRTLSPGTLLVLVLPLVIGIKLAVPGSRPFVPREQTAKPPAVKQDG